MGKSTISMAIFNSYVSLPEGTKQGLRNNTNNNVNHECATSASAWCFCFFRKKITPNESISRWYLTSPESLFLMFQNMLNLLNGDIKHRRTAMKKRKKWEENIHRNPISIMPSNIRTLLPHIPTKCYVFPNFFPIFCWYGVYACEIRKRKHQNLGWFFNPMNTLWWTNIAIENGYRNSGFSH